MLMGILTVSEIAKKWNISERSVRNYCKQGRVKGAEQKGKLWLIPEDAEKPERVMRKEFSDNPLLNRLKEEKDMKLKGGIYHKTQIALTYNSNHIEGSTLTEDQTRMIFETNTLGETNGVKVDDIVETNNHFRCVDIIIDNAKKPLTEKFIKELHYFLKTGTSDSRKDWFNVGEYKSRPNEVGGNKTCPPEKVTEEIKKLLANYNKKQKKTINDIIKFHKDFETIHPFQDGNGRVGRLIMFKECLANNSVPFIIEDKFKLYYYRGLKEWNTERDYLTDICLAAQDKYKKWLVYFSIE